MRLVTFDAGDGPQPGELLGDQITPIEATSVRALLEHGKLKDLTTDAAQPVARADVRLLPPVIDPEKIVCMGLNFHDHAKEAHQEVPQHPRWFAKFANSLIGDGAADIVLPPAHPEYVDYEAELAVVIGRRAHRVSEDDAFSYVAGAMSFNDVSARDLQLQNPLWTSGKAIDTFAPCGPALVTLDETGDLNDLRVRTRVNGELLQDGNTKDMIFGVAETIAWLSRTMTLLPGDIIATGTPAGVGAFQNRFLRDGDVVEVEIGGLGVIPTRSGQRRAEPGSGIWRRQTSDRCCGSGADRARIP
ncbi:MAG: fumarylacetoacetate hydrolase family protein [Actinomycetota bacterium]|nr:fumarylacetoacetate hydrolase family protein [Actinomycetota bacterium]